METSMSQMQLEAGVQAVCAYLKQGDQVVHEACSCQAQHYHVFHLGLPKSAQ